MNSTDLLSWLLAILIVSVVVAGAFFTLAVLRPDLQSIELRAADAPDGSC